MRKFSIRIMTSKPERINRTGFRSLAYRSGFVYNWLTKRLYDQKKKFLTIGKLIGENKTVLDLPCGTGYLTRFLHPTTNYIGIDLNHRFLKKIKLDFLKGRASVSKITIKQGDIFDYNNYPNEKLDAIVFCDILHHIYGKHIDIVENAKKSTNKIIICEPVAIKPADITARTKIFNFVIKSAKHLPESLLKKIDFLFLDNDGINSYDQRSTWQQNERTLKQLYYDYGIKDKDIYKITDDYIGVWKA